MSKEPTDAPIRFGRFELQPEDRRLVVDGRDVGLGPRAFDVLTILAGQPGELVSKEELLQRVWPNLVVEENNLPVQVSALRKILGAEAIATVQGRGYRFTGNVAIPAAAHRNNLPQPLTSFVGHDGTLVEYAKLLDQTRLLTLTGIGGSGKTRMAIRLAERVADTFPDGVAYVDLAPIADPERVPVAVAATMGVREEPTKPIEETLARELAGQRVLLVLDNCEHLLESVATLLEPLLQSAPGVRALVTSREGLGIAGERTAPVRSLSIPPRDSIDPDRIPDYESVRLFVDRARQVAPEFELGAANAGVVAEICRRLDGIPLAIELAAAWVRMLSIEQIRARLDDRFRLLTGSTRAVPRHQTLLATLHWSYDHLTSDEQRMFRRLAVFAGGWSLAAAVAVAGDGDELRCVEHMSRLIDKSLVLVDRTAADGPRYSMLETVREYAYDRLLESGERDATRERHLACFLAVAQDALPRFFTPDVREALETIDREFANVLGAHRWCDHALNGAVDGLELAAALRVYWFNRGLFALGQTVYEEALARPGAQARTMARARALFALGQHNFFRGDVEAVVAPVEQALAIAREHGDNDWVCRCLYRLATALCWLGERARALACADEELVVARATGDERQICLAFSAKGQIFRACGDPSSAMQAYSQAIDRLTRDPWNANANLRELALVLVERGELQRAAALLAQVVRDGMDIGSAYGHPADSWVAARLAAALGEWERAARLQGSSDAAVHKMGATFNGRDDAISAALRERPRAMLGAQTYTAAYRAGRALPVETAVAELLEWLGNVHAQDAPLDDSVACGEAPSRRRKPSARRRSVSR